MPESPSNCLKTRKNLEPKMASWVGDQDQVNLAKNAKTTPDITSPTENPKPKMEITILN